MLIDTHTHLDFPQFDNDRKDVIERAKKEGILIINSGLGPDGIEKTIKLVDEYGIFATLGLSPTEFNDDIIENTIDLIKKYRNKIVGIGEVGLDYYWVKEPEKRRKEIENFRIFIELSNELNLPLLVHSRDAEKDIIDELKFADKPAILHCFSGTINQAKEATSIGCLISIPTSVVNSKQKQELAKSIPVNSIVLETDSPYLSPTPKTRNEPINVKLIAEEISKIKGIDSSVVEKITTENAMKFFNMILHSKFIAPKAKLSKIRQLRCRIKEFGLI